MLTHIHPSRFGLHARLVPSLWVLVVPAQRLGQSRNRQVPRAPLPASGVTLGSEMSSISSEGVTPPSSLIRTHASDHNPPADFGCPYFGRSLQVAVSPCWKMALPDVISAICVEVLGPIPRRVPVGPVRLGTLPSGRAHRPQDIGLTPVLTGSAREFSLQCNFHRGGLSGLQSFAHVQAPRLTRSPGCTYRCAETQGSRTVYITQ